MVKGGVGVKRDKESHVSQLTPAPFPLPPAVPSPLAHEGMKEQGVKLEFSQECQDKPGFMCTGEKTQGFRVKRELQSILMHCWGAGF